MAHRLKTPEGRDLYALRKQTPEPVFRQSFKSVLGFRQFSMRGLEKVRGEWSLVTMAWNMKRMFASTPPEEAICSFAQPKVAWCKVIRRSHNPFWTPSSVR